LYYLTGQTDIIVGADIANRNRAETEKLIGFFVNQLVLRTKLSHDYTFEAFLKNVREITLGAYAHQDLPFEKLVEALNPNRAENRSPLFQVKMALQNAPVEELSLPGLTLSPISVTNETAKFDLLLNLTDTAQGLSASLQFDADLFDESTPERMLNRFHTLLDRVVERPDATLQDLVAALVEEDKREQMGRRGEFETIRSRRLQSAKRRPIADTNMGGER
jgi:non-ribosomal peptide synthetase component F